MFLVNRSNSPRIPLEHVNFNGKCQVEIVDTFDINPLRHHPASLRCLSLYCCCLS